MNRWAALVWMALQFANLGSFSGWVWAHGGHHHKSHHEAQPEAVSPPALQKPTALQVVNERYRQDILPIFENKCFDCHGAQKRFPWYQNWPGAKQLIQKDRVEAQEHLKMGTDFPFESHATPLEDLEALEESTVQKNEMPPKLYRWMHSETNLTAEEKEKLHQWIQSGKSMLKAN